MFFKVALGSKVSVKCRPFLLLDKVCEMIIRKRKRRTRSALNGVAIKSLPNGRWRVCWGNVNRSSDYKTINPLGVDSGLTKDDLDTIDREETCIDEVDSLRSYTLENNLLNDGCGNDVSIGITTYNANSSPAATDALQKQLDSPNKIFTHKERAECIKKEVKEFNEAKEKERDCCSQWL